MKFARGVYALHAHYKAPILSYKVFLVKRTRGGQEWVCATSIHCSGWESSMSEGRDIAFWSPTQKRFQAWHESQPFEIPILPGTWRRLQVLRPWEAGGAEVLREESDSRGFLQARVLNHGVIYT